MTILLEIFKQRRNVIALALALVLATVGIGTLLTPPRYTSDGMLRIGTATGGSVDFINYQPDYSDRVMNTLAKYSESSVVAERLRTEFNVQAMPIVRTNIVAKTELFQFSVTSENPQLAYAMAVRLTDILSGEDGKSLTAEFDEFVDSLNRDVEAAQADATRAEAAFERALAATTVDKTTTDSLRRAADLARNIYEKKLDRLGQLQILSAAKARTFVVISPPSLPTRPSSPSMLFNLMLALAFGLLGGLAIALLLEKVDPVLHSLDQVSSALRGRVPLLGAIAPHTHGFRASWNEFFEPESAQARAVSRLIQRLAALKASHNLVTIALVSAEPGEGKTVLAANLALQLAQSGANVALIDSNFRRARLADLFQLPLRRGLSEVLTKKQYWANVVQYCARNLQLMQAGAYNPKTPTPFTHKRVKHLLDEMANEFDYVLLDTPALLPNSDALKLARSADAVIVIARCHKTHAKTLDALLAQLRDGDVYVLGALVNATNETPTPSDDVDSFHPRELRPPAFQPNMAARIDRTDPALNARPATLALATSDDGRR